MNVQTVDIDHVSRAVVHDQFGRMFFRTDALMEQLIDSVFKAEMPKEIKAPMLILLAQMENQFEILNMDMQTGFNEDQPIDPA